MDHETTLHTGQTEMLGTILPREQSHNGLQRKGPSAARERRGTAPHPAPSSAPSTNDTTALDPLTGERRRARQGANLAQVLFGLDLDNPLVEPHEHRPSEVTCRDIGAQLAAMFDEPDGVRLVRAALQVLNQLNLVTDEDIINNLIHLAPELLAVPSSFPADDPVTLLKRYLARGEIMSGTRTWCVACGTGWTYDEARRWIWFEGFIWGMGCPSCREDWQ